MLAVKLDHSWRDIADRALHLSVEFAQLFQDKIWAVFFKTDMWLICIRDVHITVNRFQFLIKHENTIR